MSWGANLVPSYRLHEPTGQAVVTPDGRNVHLGLHEHGAKRTTRQKNGMAFVEDFIKSIERFDVGPVGFRACNAPCRNRGVGSFGPMA